ncbi:hypothetical protein [Pseudoxanthomonas winnipegensis]|jgi:hypothetical protein|uniref:hypothetical protein n=1 Tax=Pseudoxanthomonas winnipegensis TaxID=2480810 RepID=UPI0013EF17AA|nr:hypothetical protein [Pseudoxanthomonas winnipegensis]
MTAKSSRRTELGSCSRQSAGCAGGVLSPETRDLAGLVLVDSMLDADQKAAFLSSIKQD